MKFTAAGDAIIQKRIPDEYPGYAEISDFIKEGDGRFYNLETTLNYEGECFASQFSGGTYIRTVPEVLYDLDKFGFNMTTFNNNHTMDFSYEGLYRTLDSLNEFGIVHAGVGMNLGEACAPKFLETKNGRVALIAVSTSFNRAMLAGDPAERVKGRPGVFGLRVESTMKVPKADLEYVKELAERANCNVERSISVKEGYAEPLPENEALLCGITFSEGEKAELVRTLNRTDVERLKRSIFEAKLQADYIMISVHSHELGGDKKENPSQFLIDLAHECIDAGADAIVGHGPHLLRPIEVYKGCPIFYSLGDFILELYGVEFAPADFFANHNCTTDMTVHELLKKRSANFTRGLMEDSRMALSVIPLWETDDNNKLVSLKLLPIEMKMDGKKGEQGLPRVCDAKKVVDYLGEMSKPYGVTLTAEKDGTITCKW